MDENIFSPVTAEISFSTKSAESAYDSKEITELLNHIERAMRRANTTTITTEVAEPLSTTPSRFAGSTDVASELHAVRHALTTGTLPPDRKQKTDFILHEEVKKVPYSTLQLHIFCEVGIFAKLDPTHIQKLQTIARWKPPGYAKTVVSFYPIYASITDTHVETKPTVIELLPEENQEERVQKLVNLFLSHQHSSPVESPGVNKPEHLLLEKRPTQSLLKLVPTFDESKDTTFGILVTTGVDKEITGVEQMGVTLSVAKSRGDKIRKKVGVMALLCGKEVKYYNN